MKYKIQGIIVPKRLPPIHPSQVFLGEIFGHILFLPKNFPEKRANESVITGIETKYEETRAANLCYSALFALLGEDSYTVTTERIIKKSSDSRPYNIDWTELERIKY